MKSGTNRLIDQKTNRPGHKSLVEVRKSLAARLFTGNSVRKSPDRQCSASFLIIAHYTGLANGSLATKLLMASLLLGHWKFQPGAHCQVLGYSILWI